MPRLLAVFAVLAVIGMSAGLMVRAARHHKPAAVVVPASHVMHPQTTPAKPAAFAPGAIVPADYTVYRDDQYGFSFAFPARWGRLAGRDQLRYTLETAGTLNNLQGSMELSHYGLDAKFRPKLSDAGPTLVPTATDGTISWKVGDDSAPGAGYKVGDTYKAAVARTVGTTTIYDLPLSDSGAIATMWVFATKQGYVQIVMPYLLAADAKQKMPSTADTAAYNQLKHTILQTFQIF